MKGQEESIESRLEKMTGLYQEDPEAFERMRQELIRQTVDSFPESSRQRAYGIQFTLDATLDRCKDPIGRMNKMVEIFWKQFHRFQEAITDPDFPHNQKRNEGETAKVIPFDVHRNRGR